MNIEIDSYDERILAELQNDARVPMAELGRRVHLSQPAVTERVRKLEAAGVIRGYHAVVDPLKLGYALRAVVRVGECNFAAITRRLETMSEVRTAHNITGADSWLLEVVVRDVAHLDALLWTLKEFGETATTIILRTLREHAPLPPAADTAQAMAAGAAKIKSKAAARGAAAPRKSRRRT